MEEQPDGEKIDALITKNKIPNHYKPELAHYFDCLPLVPFQQWEGLVVTVTEYLFGGKLAGISYLQFDPGGPIPIYIPQQGAFLSLHLMEEIYTNEEALLNAIKAGDTKAALQCLAPISHYRVLQFGAEKISSAKAYLHVFDTLLRKAVQDSSVHPLHIHSVSSDFSQRIEAAKRIDELKSLVEEMIRRYCALVRNYSLANLSRPIRNIINYVKFNLKEPLSRSVLAKQFNMDPSNLSHAFSRELGISLTDFINSERLEYAKHLLTGSSMYVPDIAEECGFEDINYLCRLFKRKYGKTPRQYRNSLHAEA
jgi:AraC-like DNA-binding protein